MSANFYMTIDLDELTDCMHRARGGAGLREALTDELCSAVWERLQMLPVFTGDDTPESSFLGWASDPEDALNLIDVELFAEPGETIEVVDSERELHGKLVGCLDFVVSNVDDVD